MAEAELKRETPFERIGGRLVIERMVNRFYDLVEHDPAYAELRAMHAPNLAPTRISLADFFTGWMGGSRHWFDARPGACIMSVHSGLGVTRQTADQWVGAMRQAVDETVGEPAMRNALMDMLERMTKAMVRER